MTMNAKFAGTCKRCGGAITVGEAIDWTKGVGAVHVQRERCEAARAAKAAQPVVTKDAAPIVAFLMAAKERGLKFPKARFLTADQKELRLSVAGDKSRCPGAVNVVVSDVYIGRIAPDGTVSAGLAARADLLATLDIIAADPAKAAAAYGALMGRCSFCDLTITDAGSVEVGYGPICAARYGLPHTPKGTPAVKEVAA